jgi:SAM-dependent methyltransferase
MSSDKKSTLQVIGIPKEFGVLLLTFALILAVSPYLGGTDLGIFKVPSFSPKVGWALCFLGPILLLVAALLFLPFWEQSCRPSAALTRSVDSVSRYRLQSITDIVRAEAANHGIQIDGIQIGDRLHINDLEQICTRAWFPNKSADEIKRVLQAARATAFSRKYAEPRGDEKLVDVSTIQIEGIRPWHRYFTDLLKDLGVKDFNQLDILDVGIGNGHAEEPFLSQLHSFKAVDISNEALQYADKKYVQMTRFVCAAEDLTQIPNNSVDLYMSLRAYQCTLFNRRAALHEAYRVLRNGGIIVLSIPIMYLQENGKVLTGLIPPGSTAPNMEYARHFAERIKDYLTILNFRDVKMDERSPFENFLCARR